MNQNEWGVKSPINRMTECLKEANISLKQYLNGCVTSNTGVQISILASQLYQTYAQQWGLP